MSLENQMHFSVMEPPGDLSRGLGHVGDVEAEHRWIWRWFAAPDGTARDFLFRRHHDVGPGAVGVAGVRYFTVSERPPLERLDGWTARTRPYAPQLGEGDRLLFELRANPVIQRSAPARGDGRAARSTRHDVVMDAKVQWARGRGASTWRDTQDRSDRPALAWFAQQAGSDWIARQGELNGFVVNQDDVVCEGYEQHGQRDKPSRQFSTLDFRGALTVTDPVAFGSALTRGIGRAKGFGCGLMVVRRAQPRHGEG